MTEEQKPYYKLISNFIIECNIDQRDIILDKLTDALIDIVESIGCYCGGGFQLKGPLAEDEYFSDE
jgi:hypothetical protein